MAQRLVKTSPTDVLNRSASMRRPLVSRALSLAFLFLCSLGMRAVALENRYDLFSRLLVPFAKVVSSDPANAGSSLTLNCTVQLQSRGVLSDEHDDFARQLLQPTPVEILIQNPDKMLARVGIGETTLTLCRNGRKLWAAPVELAQRLAQQLHIDLTRTDGHELPPLRLPFSEKQFALLPVFFNIADAGTQDGHRILNVEPMAELAKQMPPHRARLHIANSSLARIELFGPYIYLNCQIKGLEFSKALPTTTWQTPETALSISPGAFSIFMEKLTGADQR